MSGVIYYHNRSINSKIGQDISVKLYTRFRRFSRVQRIEDKYLSYDENFRKSYKAYQTCTMHIYEIECIILLCNTTQRIHYHPYTTQNKLNQNQTGFNPFRSSQRKIISLVRSTHKAPCPILKQLQSASLQRQHTLTVQFSLSTSRAL